MRTYGLIGCLTLVAACNSPQPQANQSAAGNAVLEQPMASVAEVTQNKTQIVEASPETRGHSCLTQDGTAVAHKLKAIGTEPFWATEVVGRCVTYKTPEDQRGTRVWAHVETGPDGPAWNGALRGRQFQLYVKPAAPPGCSDGMSDKTYSLDAVLRVDGETRHGCAEQH